MEKNDLIFDSRTLLKHRARAGRSFKLHDFMMQEVAKRLTERLLETNRNFDTGVGICWQHKILHEAINSVGKINNFIGYRNSKSTNSEINQIISETELLPLAPNSVDLIVSLLDWHWVNDFPGILSQSLTALKADGLMLGAMFGGETLNELRSVLLEAEIITTGGVTPRVSPFVNVETVGNLLSRVGFALPIVDTDNIKVTYPNALKLMHEIRGMGESNCLIERCKNFTRKDTLLKAADLYQNKFGTKDGKITATFQIIFITAWAPHKSQPKPLRRGSGKYPLESAINNTEKFNKVS